VRRFGDGYKLSITAVRTEQAPLAAIRTFVRDEVCAGAEETSCQGNALTFSLPRQGVDVASLFQVGGASGMGFREQGARQDRAQKALHWWLIQWRWPCGCRRGGGGGERHGQVYVGRWALARRILGAN
jgi:hypothetical protein